MSSQLIRLLLVGAVLGTHAIKLQQASQVPAPSDLIIRYALLSPSGAAKWLNTKGVPAMQTSICLFEKHFVPAWRDRFGSRPTYMIYTDDHSHKLVSDVIANMPYPTEVFLLRNLDEEQSKIPNTLFGKFKLDVLDDVDRASIRREFADASLPVNVARLLVGPDVMILGTPQEFIDSVQQNASTAWYLADRRSYGELYQVTDFDGPQCPGLTGDFVYLPPNANVTANNLQNKLDFYMKQPLSVKRLNVPCEDCVSKSGGFHGADEIAWSLAIPEAAPCQALSWKYAHHPKYIVSAMEAVHGRDGAPPQYGC